MKYYVTKNDKPATRTTTFNMTEESLAIVKETVKALKILGVAITQGEVINDLIASHSSSDEKVYQIDGKTYSVEELCELAFSTKADGTVEDYIEQKKIKDLVDEFYKELQSMEEQLNEDAVERANEELEQEYEYLDEEEQEEIDLEGYKEENIDEKLEYIYEDMLYEREEEIEQQITLELNKLKDKISSAIYEVPFEYLIKASSRSENKIQQVIQHFYPVTDTIRLMEGLGAYRKYKTNQELSNTQINYILKEKIGTDPGQYQCTAAYEGITKLEREGKVQMDIIFFIKMENDVKENGEKYCISGVRLF